VEIVVLLDKFNRIGIRINTATGRKLGRTFTLMYQDFICPHCDLGYLSLKCVGKEEKIFCIFQTTRRRG
jgi:hypothetical protein